MSKETISQTEGLCKEVATCVRNAYDRGYKQGEKDGYEYGKRDGMQNPSSLLEQKPCDDWHDVPSDEMTFEQAKQAVKDLRKKLAEYLEQEPQSETITNDTSGYLEVVLPECDDCISRQAIKRKLQERHDFFIHAYNGFSNMPQNDKSRVDEINNCIAMIVNEPSVTPKEKTGHWINKTLIYKSEAGNEYDCYAGTCSVCGETQECWNYCSGCGARMVERTI